LTCWPINRYLHVCVCVCVFERQKERQKSRKIYPGRIAATNIYISLNHFFERCPTFILIFFLNLTYLLY
jgi:hypothetical protein